MTLPVEEPEFEEYQILPEKKIELSVKRTQEPLSSILRSKKKKKRKEETTSVSTGSTVLYSTPQQFATKILKQPLPDSWYKDRVEIIRKLYPDLPRHNISANKSWYQVYLKYLKDMGLNPFYRADLTKELNMPLTAGWILDAQSNFNKKFSILHQTIVISPTTIKCIFVVC